MGEAVDRSAYQPKYEYKRTYDKIFMYSVTYGKRMGRQWIRTFELWKRWYTEPTSIGRSFNKLTKLTVHMYFAFHRMKEVSWEVEHKWWTNEQGRSCESKSVCDHCKFRDWVVFENSRTTGFHLGEPTFPFLWWTCRRFGGCWIQSPSSQAG